MKLLNARIREIEEGGDSDDDDMLPFDMPPLVDFRYPIIVEMEKGKQDVGWETFMMSIRTRIGESDTDH